MHGKDPSQVHKTKSFNIPVQKCRSGANKGEYKYPSGTLFYTCFSSDFFHPDADEWRYAAWKMMQIRSDCFFMMITKRPERILQNLPDDWENGYENVEIAWVLDIRNQCMDYQVPFHYHQTGAKLLKDGKLYDIPRKYQHNQARKAGIEYKP